MPHSGWVAEPQGDVGGVVFFPSKAGASLQAGLGSDATIFLEIRAYLALVLFILLTQRQPLEDKGYCLQYKGAHFLFFCYFSF